MEVERTAVEAEMSMFVAVVPHAAPKSTAYQMNNTAQAPPTLTVVNVQRTSVFLLGLLDYVTALPQQPF